MPETSTQGWMDDYMRRASAYPGYASGWEILFNPHVPGFEEQGEGSQKAVPESRLERVACGDIDAVTGTVCTEEGTHLVHNCKDADGAFEFRWKYNVPYQADGVILDPEDAMLSVPEVSEILELDVVPLMY